MDNTDVCIEVPAPSLPNARVCNNVDCSVFMFDPTNRSNDCPACWQPSQLIVIRLKYTVQIEGL